MTNELILPKRILVVDDEKSIRECLRMLLECDGHQVESAGSGPEALEKFAHGKFDVVTTDMKMDGMNGDQLAEAIKSRAPHQPIIMISAHETNQSESVDCLISKPFTGESLRKALAAVLEEPAHHSK